MAVHNIETSAKMVAALADRIKGMKGKSPVHGRPQKISIDLACSNLLTQLTERIKSLEYIVAKMELRQNAATARAQDAFNERIAAERADEARANRIAAAKEEKAAEKEFVKEDFEEEQSEDEPRKPQAE